MTPGAAADHSRALSDPRTRWALARHSLRALGVLLLATGLAAVAGLLLTDDGSTSDGVPELLPDLLITVALLAGGVGVLSLLNLVRVTWVLARHPWTTTEAKLQQDGRDWLTVASLGGMNDPPVLSLRQGAGETTVTLLAPVWRWRRFARSELLFAGRPGRGGVVATTDRASLVWAGRSLATRWRSRRGTNKAPGS